MSSTDPLLMDPMLKDHKEMENSHMLQALPMFLLHTCIILPIWAVVLLPAAAIYQAGSYCSTLMCGKRKNGKKEDSSVTGTASSTSQPMLDTETGMKKAATCPYDLVLYGATGFTGTLAATYLAKNYGLNDSGIVNKRGGEGKGLKWAIAGRRRAALEEIRDQLTRTYGPVFADLPIIVADASNEEVCDLAIIQAVYNIVLLLYMI